jgi:hypothetical protein
VEKLAITEPGLNERSYAWREPGAGMNGAALLQLLLAEEVPFALYPFVRMSKPVRICGACLHGVEGLLTQWNLTQWNKEKLVMSIESIQRSLAIETQGYEVGMA